MCICVVVTVRFYGCCGKVGLRVQSAFAWFFTHTHTHTHKGMCICVMASVRFYGCRRKVGLRKLVCFCLVLDTQEKCTSA